MPGCVARARHRNSCVYGSSGSGKGGERDSRRLHSAGRHRPSSPSRATSSNNDSSASMAASVSSTRGACAPRRRGPGPERLRTATGGLGKEDQTLRAEGKSQRSVMMSRYEGGGGLNDGAISPLVRNLVVTRGTANTVRAASGLGSRNRRL